MKMSSTVLKTVFCENVLRFGSELRQSCQIVHFRTRFSAISKNSVQFQNLCALKKFSANFSAFEVFTKYKEISEENEGNMMKNVQTFLFYLKY